MNNVNESYSKLAPYYETVLGSIFSLIPHKVEEYFQSLPPNSLILDAGCGPGIEAEIAVKRYFHKVVGLDANENMLKRFLEKLPESEVLQNKITNISSDDSVFDSIFCSCVLLHLNKIQGEKALSELYRVLKMDGSILFITSILKGEEDYHKRKTLMDIGIEYLYFYHWLYEDLIQTIEKIGFKINYTEKLGSIITGRPDAVIIYAKK